MEPLMYRGSTSDFSRLSSGVIVKSPMKVWAGNPNRKRLEDENEKAISIERRILEKLGSHPRIVPFIFGSSCLRGHQLAEASYGNLQQYIDSNNTAIGNSLRWKLAMQTIEAVVYLHGKGVIHSDLRPENYLVHAMGGPLPDLWLCDFGGSKCDELGLEGNHLPDDPFFDPQMPCVSTPATDIFSLGSICYTILTGYWPYRDGPPPVNEAKAAYDAQVIELFQARKFPDVSNLSGGKVIKGCWDHQYRTAEDALRAIKSEMAALGM